MDRSFFLFAPHKCIGCMACQMACKEENGLAPGRFFRRVSVVTWNGHKMFFSGNCLHCGSPACVEVCPSGAMHRAEDGTVRHDRSLCIGCERCVFSCPYGAVSFDAASGYVSKCEACALRRGKGLWPACVSACPMGALAFGTRIELAESLAGDEVLSAELPDFLDHGGDTDPSLLIKIRNVAAEEGAEC